MFTLDERERIPVRGRKGVGNRYVVSWAARGDEASIPSESKMVPDTFLYPEGYGIFLCVRDSIEDRFSNRR